MLKTIMTAALAAGAGLCAVPAMAISNCSDLPSYDTLHEVLQKVVARDKPGGTFDAGGFHLNMWATLVDRDGIVCAIAFSGSDRGDQWPGSRVISAQKANTANSYSLPGLALSSANLWAATQPGGSLFGLQFSNPVNPAVAYGDNGPERGPEDGRGKSPKGGKSPAANYGLKNDPLVGEFVGGVNVFGGGLALYGPGGKLIGALGLSGDSSCADHNKAWQVRDLLGLDYVPAGVAPASNPAPNTDNIIYDVTTDPTTGLGVSAGGFGHVKCTPTIDAVNAAIVKACPAGGGTSGTCKQ